MKKLILFLIFALCSISTYSQHSTITINGLSLSASYSGAQITAALGIPTNIRYPSPDDDIPEMAEYHYRSSEFVFQTGDFIDFTIRDTLFKVNNYLVVGMDSSALNLMGGLLIPGKSPGVYNWAPSENYFNETGYLIIHTDISTHKITMISGETAVPII